VIAVPRVDGPDDALDYRGVGEKVLTESLAWNMPARRH
jgi:hypothetical protein